MRMIEGYNLKKLRELNNLSQEAMAQEIDSSKSVISAVENARRGLGEEVWTKIVQKFGIDYADLLKVPTKWTAGNRIIREPKIPYGKAEREFDRLKKEVKEILDSENDIVIELLKSHVKDFLKIIRKEN